jgi:hypothetical protein
VHNRVGPHLAHGGEQVLAVHHVGHHGLSAGVAQPLSVGLAAGDADPGGRRPVSGVPTAPEAPASSTLMASSLTCSGPRVASVRSPEVVTGFVGLGAGSFLPLSLIVAGFLSGGWVCPGTRQRRRP